MNAVGNIRVFFLNQLRFRGGQERWCREMKADIFRYTEENKMKKENS